MTKFGVTMKVKILLTILIAATASFAHSPSYASQIDPLVTSNSRDTLGAPVGTPICGPVENVSGTISTNTTWEAGKVYVLTGDITVNQLTTLIIQPGAVVKMNYDKGFAINGKLIASGTTENPIYFTSVKDDSICGDTNGDSTATVPNTGDWRWIDFSSTSDSQSAFSRAVVRYGGRNDRSLYNDEWRAPLRLINVVPQLGSITFEKNYRNAVAVTGGNWLTNELNSPTVIHFIESGLVIPQGNKFTIHPGVRLKIPYDTGIQVDGNLFAAGTVDAPIIITSDRDDTVCGVGANDEPICDTNNDTTSSVPGTGDWMWIYFTPTSDPTSEISYSIIRYGGRNDRSLYNDEWGASIRMENVAPKLERISFEKNWRNAAALTGGKWLSNEFTSRTVVYYLESGLTVSQANTLSFGQNLNLKIAYDTGIHVDGKLVLNGTDTMPINFTSDRNDAICGVGAAGEPICDTNNDGVSSVPAAGDWTWISFSSVSDPTSKLNFAILSYGGRNDRGSYSDEWRGVVRLDRAAPTISNSAFVDNWTGIDLISGAQPTLTCNDFEFNESPYGIYNDTPTVSVNARGNWWGSVSGPTHITNPHGKGDKVTDGIEFTPWRTTPCIIPPRAPKAAFEAVPTSGEAPLAVGFFNTSTGAVTSSQWNFGDGRNSNQLNPIHTYTKPGKYPVSLTVSGPAGMDSVTSNAYIEVTASVYRMYTPVVVSPRK